MNGRRSKKLRKKIYGEDGSIRNRRYVRMPHNGQVMRDLKRLAYQQAKKEEE